MNCNQQYILKSSNIGIAGAPRQAIPLSLPNAFFVKLVVKNHVLCFSIKSKPLIGLEFFTFLGRCVRICLSGRPSPTKVLMNVIKNLPYHVVNGND